MNKNKVIYEFLFQYHIRTFSERQKFTNGFMVITLINLSYT